jgi:hypothetical protein
MNQDSAERTGLFAPCSVAREWNTWNTASANADPWHLRIHAGPGGLLIPAFVIAPIPRLILPYIYRNWACELSQ